MNIEVIRIKRMNAGNLRALAELRVGDITICDCRIIQQPGQQAFVSGPQKKVNDRWFPLVKMSKPLRDEVENLVLAEAREEGIIQ